MRHLLRLAADSDQCFEKREEESVDVLDQIKTPSLLIPLYDLHNLRVVLLVEVLDENRSFVLAQFFVKGNLGAALDDAVLEGFLDVQLIVVLLESVVGVHGLGV